MEGILKQSSCLKCPHLIYKVVLESGYLNVSATVTWQDQRPSLKASFSPSPLERMQQTGISHFIPLRPLYSQYTRFCMWVAKPALRHHHYLSIGETNLPPMSKPCHVGVSYTEQKKQFCWECKKYTKLCFSLNLQFWSHYTVCMTLLPLFLYPNSLFRCKVQLMLECPTTALAMAELNSCKTVPTGSRESILVLSQIKCFRIVNDFLS